MKRIAVLILALALSGCSTMTAVCPDGKSTGTYKGTNVLSASSTSLSCTGTATGDTVSVTGVDLAALAAAVAPYLPAAALAQPKAQNANH